MRLSNVLLIATLNLFVALSAVAGDSQMTTLRVTDKKYTYRQLSISVIEVTATADVKNIGSFDAHGVEVEMVFPDGKTKQLAGPSTLKKYEKGVYSYVRESSKLVTGNVTVRVSCDNCR